MVWLVDHPRYNELLAALDAGQAWRALAEIEDESGPVLTAAVVAQAERRPSPAHFLLEYISLLNGPLTAEDTESLLRCVGGPAAAAAADLLRPPQPLRVRSLADTNTAEVWSELGGVLVLRCEAEAWPPPSYQWRRDGQLVGPSAGGDAAQLSVQPFTAADAGQYSCEVRDASGLALSAGTVSVKPKQTPPRQEGRQVSGGTLTGDEVSAPGDRPLRLRVDWIGWPEPALRWKRDGQLMADAHGPEITLQPGPEMADATFVCIATNAVGKISSDKFKVLVNQRPVILEHPKPAHRYHPIGRPLRLRCSAFCRRPLRVIWRRSADGDGGGSGYEVLSPQDVRTETTDSGEVHSELEMTPTEAEARQLCSVTCEFLADGDSNSFIQSQPAKFRVVYSAHSKMALIIGNSAYEHLDRLHQVEQDVADFHSAIRELGFGTLLTVNLTTARSRRVVDYFARVTQPGAYLVVLVAGHGFTHQRQDYLAPVDYPALKGGSGTGPHRCLSMLDDLENRLRRTSPGLLVICSDMCRTKTEASATAAAVGFLTEQPPRAEPNVVRLFSTQMGHEAMDNSKFMRRLLQNIKSDISVQQLSLRTLGAVSGPSPATNQGPQHPIVELSLAECRSLMDPADNQSVLDVHVDNKTLLQESDVFFTLATSWSNYVWDGEPELLLTVRLVDAPSGYYVSKVAFIQTTPALSLKTRVEMGDCSSPVSSWRVTGLSPAVSEVRTRLLVTVRRPERLFYRTGQLCLQFSREQGLLCGGPDVTRTAAAPAAAVPAIEEKISNMAVAADR